MAAPAAVPKLRDGAGVEMSATRRGRNPAPGLPHFPVQIPQNQKESCPRSPRFHCPNPTAGEKV